MNNVPRGTLMYKKQFGMILFHVEHGLWLNPNILVQLKNV